MAVNKAIPQSRLMIEYDTRVDGVKKKKELPYRVLIMSDASKGKSKDAQLAFQDRNIRPIKNGVDAALKDMQVPLKLTVPNYINPDKVANIDIDCILEGMKDFTPDQIAQKIPQVRMLLKMREMLVNFEKDVDNNRAIRDTLDGVFSDQEQIDTLKKELVHLPAYHLEQKQPDQEPKPETTEEEK